MIQAFYQALQNSISLGKCIWDPIYQGNCKYETNGIGTLRAHSVTNPLSHCNAHQASRGGRWHGSVSKLTALCVLARGRAFLHVYEIVVKITDSYSYGHCTTACLPYMLQALQSLHKQSCVVSSGAAAAQGFGSSMQRCSISRRTGCVCAAPHADTYGWMLILAQTGFQKSAAHQVSISTQSLCAHRCQSLPVCLILQFLNNALTDRNQCVPNFEKLYKIYLIHDDQMSTKQQIAFSSSSAKKSS